MPAGERDDFEDLRPSVARQDGKLVIPPDAVDAMRRGDLISAVKVLRQVKGMGLAEATAALAQFQHQAPRSIPRPAPHRFHAKGLSPGEVPRAGAANPAVWIILFAAVLVIVYALFGQSPDI